MRLPLRGPDWDAPARCEPSPDLVVGEGLRGRRLARAADPAAPAAPGAGPVLERGAEELEEGPEEGLPLRLGYWLPGAEALERGEVGVWLGG